MRLYLAGPLFTQAERRWLRDLAGLLRERGHRVFLPQDEVDEALDAARVFEINRGGIDACEVLVAILDGADADSGTCWECGYAVGLAKPFVAVRTDFRGGDDEGLNLMLRQSAAAVIEHAPGDERLEPLVAAIDGALGELEG